MPDTLQPTRARERLLHLDVLRGFALFGILLVNFEFFSRPAQSLLLAAEPPRQGLNLAADWLVALLAEAKFYPLFSMLFGIGFALMLERAQARTQPFWGLYARRLGILLLFGLAHRLLVWTGDILLSYALAGFLMILLFRHTPTPRLLPWSLLLLLLPLAANWLGTLALLGGKAVAPDIFDAIGSDAALIAKVEAAESIYRAGSYGEVLRLRLVETLSMIEFDLSGLPTILGFFLLGRWLLESGRLREPGAHPGFFRLLRRWGLGLGLGLSLAAVLMIYQPDPLELSLWQAVGASFYTLAGIVLALGYLGQVTTRATQLGWLAPAGRMALSNYLLQSLFWTWVFYGYGLGLWGQIPRFWQLLLAIGFFALQVRFSAWWLLHFRFGPAEWLWRSLTYLRPQPFLRRSNS